MPQDQQSSRQAASPAFVPKPFQPARPGDSRSPCPALNSLANHNYLRHDGKDLRFFDIIHALQAVYNLSTPLAWILAIAAFGFCGSFTIMPRSWSYPKNDPEPKSGFIQRVLDWLPIPRLRVDLHDIAKHGYFRIEHDASLTHADAAPGARFAPTVPDAHLLRELAQSGSDYQPAADESEAKETTQLMSKDELLRARMGRTKASDGAMLTLFGVVLARFRRDNELPAGHKLPAFQDKIAKGECALLLLIMSSNNATASTTVPEDLQVPREWVLEWFGEERLPAGWTPPKEVVGLKEASKVSKVVAKEVARLQRYT